MYVEIELGQRLGPNPGSPPGKKIIGPDYLGIPQPRVSELRRFYGHRDYAYLVMWKRPV